KLSLLSNFTRQVLKLLSQPAVTAKASATATSSDMLCQSSIVTAPSGSSGSRLCTFTSALRPAFAPLVQVTSPRLNQPLAKAPRPETVKVRGPESAVTAPSPLNAD